LLVVEEKMAKLNFFSSFMCVCGGSRLPAGIAYVGFIMFAFL